MKILQCVGDINPALGGSVEAARQLSIGLDDLGHRVELVTLRRPQPEWAREWRGAVHDAGPAATYYLYSSRLHRWIEERAPDYDAIVIHGLWRYTSIGAWRGLRRHRVPYFVFAHGMLDPYFKRAFRWKHAKKSLCWRIAESRVVREASAVLFTSEEEKLRARSTFTPYQCCESVVGLGIRGPDGDPVEERRAFFTAYPELAGKRIVLFLGRIHPKKGCDLLADAFARAAPGDPRLHLVLAGPDECGRQADLARQAAGNDLGNRVTFTGPLYGALKWGALHAADVFALPSHTENFGITVVEALACGVPVLISNEVNIWREIESDGAGLVEPPTVEGAHSLLRRWLGLSETGRDRMRANARRCFQERYELERFARRFLECVSTA